MEHDHILQVLQKTGKSGAAGILGINASTLLARMEGRGEGGAREGSPASARPGVRYSSSPAPKTRYLCSLCLVFAEALSVPALILLKASSVRERNST